MRNVFEAILETGHDEDFVPADDHTDFKCTDAPAGSKAKLDILAERGPAGSAAVASRGPVRLQWADRRGPPAELKPRTASGFP